MISAAISKKENLVDRVVTIAGEARVVRHRWRKHGDGLLLTSALLGKRDKKPLAGSLSRWVANSSELVDVGKEHAEEIRKRTARISKRTGASSAETNEEHTAAPARRKRTNADLQVSSAADPLEVDLYSRPRTDARRQSRPSLADERRAHLKSEVMADPELLKELGEMVGGQNLAAEATRKAAIHEENTRAMAASLVALKHHAKTTIGRNTYNAVLAAVAGAGEHTCNPALPCNPTHRCPPAAPGHPAVSLAARAESLGVRDGTFREARARMHGVNLSVPPQQAVEQGRYLWSYRNTRNDATDQCVLDLARRFWHSDDISRASGNSGDKDMWRASKKAGEDYHPRRQLMVSGDKAFRMFLQWPPYVALKTELLEKDRTFEDPGRTTFLATRCGCLGE